MHAGSDGTGQSVIPQLPSLRAAGYDVWSLYLPADNRADWLQVWVWMPGACGWSMSALWGIGVEGQGCAGTDMYGRVCI